MSAGAVPRSVGRYAIFGEIASGGMATVLLGGLGGPGGITQKLAIKRLHAQFAKDPDFVSMFLDEARIASHVHHANVVRLFEVLVEDGELFLVMEYVRGETLAGLIERAKARGEKLPQAVSIGIAIGALAGLHAAHEASDDHGQPLGIVHRDVSPQNILVGLDGVARILDFGVAKAVSRFHTTRQGQIKGKLSYMSPEQRARRPVDRRADVFAMGVVAWEMLAGRRLFAEPGAGEVVPPSTVAAGVPRALDDAVMKALAADPAERWATARDFAIALEPHGGASTRALGEWIEHLAGADLAARQRAIAGLARIDEGTAVGPPPPPEPPVDLGAGAPLSASAAPVARRVPRAGVLVVGFALAALVLLCAVRVFGAFSLPSP